MPAARANSVREGPRHDRDLSGREVLATDTGKTDPKEKTGAQNKMIAYETSKDAKVLFVGINPHPGSYRRGVPFSNNKMFWYLLNRAGLLEEAAGIRRVLSIIRKYKPRVVCFIGKIAFSKFYGTRKCDWGWQTPIEGVPAYLMHFPIRGPASVRVKELQELKRATRIR